MENELILRLNLQFFAKDGPGGEKTEPATSKKLNLSLIHISEPTRPY